MPATINGAQVHVALESVFASRKGDGGRAGVVPSTFQVSAKIEEQLRKEGRLELSFSLTLGDPKNMVSYELRGSCTVAGGDPSTFEQLMDAAKGSGSRLPPILDIIYRQVYPSVFILAGMTSSTYPQSAALVPEHVADGPRKPSFDEEQEAEKAAPTAGTGTAAQ